MDQHEATQQEPAISTPKRTKEVMQQFGLTVKKSLGQNFLIDGNILRKIVAAAELNSDKGALEIGPGLGALTERLAQTANRVVAVEIDGRLIKVLQRTVSAYQNVHILNGDILQLDLKKLFAEHFLENQKISVVANLPYYITTPIIMKLLEERLPLEHIVVMIQKEVAERLTASPGSKQYGSLSVAIRYYTEPELVMTVPHTVFIPQPNVESAVIKLKMREKPAVYVQDESRFFSLVQACFAQRRKTISNNLAQSSFFSKMEKEKIQLVLQKIGIDPARRAETLSIEEFAALSDEVGNMKN